MYEDVKERMTGDREEGPLGVRVREVLDEAGMSSRRESLLWKLEVPRAGGPHLGHGWVSL